MSGEISLRNRSVYKSRKINFFLCVFITIPVAAATTIITIATHVRGSENDEVNEVIGLAAEI